jgi:thioredoxin reductase (NADPH)
MEQRIENAIVVGSGPAGYTAALYMARAELDPFVIEGFAWGGLLQQTTDVENYPGFPPGIMGPDLMQHFRDQAERFGARLETDDVTALEFSRDGSEPHKVWVGDDVHLTRAVVLAMGAQHRKLGVPGEQELSGRGVSYCATCDAAFFKQAPTLIVGGGDSAMEEAMFLAKFASKVAIVHRRDDFRASKIMLERARAVPNIEWLTPYVVEEFSAGEGKSLSLARRDQHGLRVCDGQIEQPAFGCLVIVHRNLGEASGLRAPEPDEKGRVLFLVDERVILRRRAEAMAIDA